MNLTAFALLLAASLGASRTRLPDAAARDRSERSEPAGQGRGAAEGERFKSDKAAVHFLEALKPAEAREDAHLSGLWSEAQTKVLTHVLESGAAEAKAGGRPTLVFDIHDTLEQIDVAGVRKGSPEIPGTPGGPEFVKAALAKGIRVIVLSNTVETQRALETSILQKLGYPVGDDHVTVMFKPDAKAEAWRDSDVWKGKAARIIASTGIHVIAHLDDKRENLDAMSKSFPDSLPLQMAMDGPGALPGKGNAAKLRDLRIE